MNNIIDLTELIILIKFFIYLIRWQIAGFLIYPLPLRYIKNRKLALFVANLIGGIGFYFFDKIIVFE